MNGVVAAPGGGAFGDPPSRFDTLQINLAYNEMTVGPNGSVLTRADKLELRTKHGFCTRCEGVPIQLYFITRSRFNPLWFTREPRAVAGECAAGVCFVCNPSRNPHPRLPRARGNGGSGELLPSGNTRGGWSGIQSAPPRVRNTSAGRQQGNVNPRSTVDVASVSSGSNGSANSGEGGSSSRNYRSISPSGRRTTESRPPLPSPSNGRPRPQWAGVYVPEVMAEAAGNEITVKLYDQHVDGPNQESMPELPTYDYEASSEGRARRSSSSAALVGRSSSPPQSPVRSDRPSCSQPASLSDEEIASIITGVDSLVQDMNSSGSSEFLVDIVLGAIREHVNCAKIQSHCLGVIWELCKENEQNRAAIMLAGAPEDIIRALKLHTQDASVQEKGCGAIWSLGVNSGFRIMLVRQKACEQIVIALQYFIATESLVKTAIGAMRTLSPEPEGRDIFQSVGAPKVVTEAMIVHRGCVSIQRDACAFLSNCAVNIEKQFVTVVPQDELDAVVQAMANHRHESSVLHGACFALKNYTHEEKNCRTLRKCKDVNSLILHASQVEQRCIDDASAVLDRIQISHTMDASLEDEACRTLQQIIDSQMNIPQGPRTILDYMRNYDWSPRVNTFCMQKFQQIASGTEGQIENIFVDDIHRQILRFCLRFDENKDVCKSTCIFLACVAVDTSHREQLVDAGACQIIFKSFVCGKTDEELVLNGLKSLELLLSVKQCYEQFKRQLGLVTEAISTHGSNVPIQYLGTKIVSSLDSPPPSDN